jgi:hypothetical protein
MNAALTPPFPIAGAGVLLFEAAIAGLLVSAFWVTSPAGFAQLGEVLAAVLFACWLLAWSLGACAVAKPKHRARAKFALVTGGALGSAGLILGFLSGPHLAGICVWGVLGQLVLLAVARVVCAT